jgi:hypothetical protein
LDDLCAIAVASHREKEIVMRMRVEVEFEYAVDGTTTVEEQAALWQKHLDNVGYAVPAVGQMKAPTAMLLSVVEVVL